MSQFKVGNIIRPRERSNVTYTICEVRDSFYYFTRPGGAPGFMSLEFTHKYYRLLTKLELALK